MIYISRLYNILSIGNKLEPHTNPEAMIVRDETLHIIISTKLQNRLTRKQNWFIYVKRLVLPKGIHTRVQTIWLSVLICRKVIGSFAAWCDMHSTIIQLAWRYTNPLARVSIFLRSSMDGSGGVGHNSNSLRSITPWDVNVKRGEPGMNGTPPDHGYRSQSHTWLYIRSGLESRLFLLLGSHQDFAWNPPFSFLDV